MTRLRRTDTLHMHGIGIEKYEIDPVMCVYCKTHEATGLRRDHKTGREVDVCSSPACLVHTEEDPAHPWPQPIEPIAEQQHTLF
jgi:hypothetical protein